MTSPEPPIFHSDRWGDRWSGDGVVLRFGNAFMATAVRLNAIDAATLAAKLHQEVARLEAQHGTFWSDDALANGARTALGLPGSIPDFLCTEGLSLYGLIRNLPLDGMEQSFKLREGELLGSRFLAGVSKDKLSDDDFHYLIASLGAPEEFRDAIRGQLEQAVFIHIGFEQGPLDCTYKVYLEFPLSEAASQVETQPLYRGFKWNPRDPLERAVSIYDQPKAMGCVELLANMRSAFGDEEGVVAQAAREIVQLATDHAQGRKQAFVRVRDSDSPRTSFDINLYDTQLELRALEPLLSKLTAALSVGERYQHVMARTQGHLLGHVSGGTDGRGRPFLTIYHAAARPPPKGSQA